MRLTLAHLKGGTGKSSLALNLGAAFAHDGDSVVIADADPQQSLNDWAAVRPEDMPMPFSVISSPRKTLHRDADKLQGGADHLVIDTPAKDGALTISAMSASDIVLLPTAPGSYDIWALEQTLEKFSEVQALYPDIKAAIVVSRAPTGSSLGREVHKILKDFEGVSLLKTVIHQRVAMARTGDGQTIFEMGADADRAKAEVRSLAKEIRQLAN